MLRDSHAGLKTEHEHILVAMTARAKQLDVDVPLIEAAYIALAIKANWGNTLKNWLNSIGVGGESVKIMGVLELIGLDLWRCNLIYLPHKRNAPEVPAPTSQQSIQ